MRPGLVVLLLAALASKSPAGEILYNGIQLPDVWPPEAAAYPDPNVRPPSPYYVRHPPAVIPINVGRQLLVDDFLIAGTTMKRTWHQAEYHPLSPIVEPDRPWEMEPVTDPGFVLPGKSVAIPSAMTFNGGAWYDPKDGLFKMWYTSLGKYLCLAVSTDGVDWIKPGLDFRPGTNIVGMNTSPDPLGANIWLDLYEADPAHRYKSMDVYFDLTTYPDPWAELTQYTMGFRTRASPDGIHWSRPIYNHKGYAEGGGFFYNPFRHVWVLNMRDNVPYWPLRGHGAQAKPLPENGNRRERYHEGPDVVRAMDWGTVPELDMGPGNPGADHSVRWCQADKFDESIQGYPPDLYEVVENAYESLILGAFSILPGFRDGTKLSYGALGFSRDGFTWDRPNRRAFLERGPFYAWNSGYIHPAVGVCLIVGDRLYFYMGTRQALPGATTLTGTRKHNTGLAILRRDGFASMDAGPVEATLTTRPVSFTGKHLFVNLDAPAGQLKVEVLDDSDTVLAASTLLAHTDKTCAAVSWNRIADLAAFAGAGKHVRFKFYLTNGRLYSLWVSPEKSGASHGYVAAGGPGFGGPIDTGQPPAPAAPCIVNLSMADGAVGASYRDTLVSGWPPIRWSITFRCLPPGLALGPLNGNISGTPTRSGTWSFRVRAANAWGFRERNLTIAIGDCPGNRSENASN